VISASVPRRVGLQVGVSAALRPAAIAALFGAQAIHVRAMIDHAPSWPAAGAFFLLLAVAEGSAAAWLLLAPSRRAAHAAIVLSFVTMAVWAVSRTTGLPVGPHPWLAEPIAAPDGISTALEMLTAIALVAWLRPVDSAASPPVARRWWAGVAIASVAAITYLGLVLPAHSVSTLH